MEEEDPVIARCKLILHINKYKHRFGTDLLHINFAQLDLLSIEQLEDLLKEIVFTIGVKNSCGMVKGIVGGGIMIAENFIPQLNGLRAALEKEQMYNDTIDEASLLYSNYIYTNPLLRLGFMISTVAMQVYHKNQANVIVNSYLSNPIPSSTNKTYQDL